TLGSNNLTLGPAATISGTPDATKMVVVTGTGQFRKQFSATGSFTFPVGDNTGTAEYSPVTLTFNDGTFGSNAYIGVRVINSKHPNNSSATHYLTRYWEVTQSNVTDPDYDITFTYADGDINGTESAIYLGKYNGSFWILLDAANVANNTISGLGLSDFSTFTGGEEGALPVNLSSFNSAVTGRNIKLSWVTASEVNNSGFDVERAKVTQAGRGNYEKIGFIQGKGAVNTATSYSYEDRNLQSGKYKYRLKQIDHNGNFEYYELSGETEVGIPKKFDLSQNYPNPFNPTTKINIDLPEDGKVEMRIYDMLGREAAVLLNEFRTAGYHTVTFNASDLSSGIYFYRIAAGKYTGIKKMVLLK
ncbi:MAG: T9SS type A sorting domain-containing protein, partial [Ignavibacteria bacterium]|nr:T9SS type A sorting domain-containing protein [Ignavibacteria bacterium]